jgi:hypothetical protein
MAQEMGGTQMTALLETVPGIASVLRSPVADALVNLMKAAAGLAEFRPEDTRELIQFAVRRGLIGADEGDRLAMDIQEAVQRGVRPKGPVKVASKARRVVPKASKRPAVKKQKPGKKRRA